MKNNTTTESLKNHEKDCGSTGVQIAHMTSKINNLSEHLKDNRKDIHSRRGLLLLLEKRRKLIKYIKRTNSAFWDKIALTLNLKNK